MLGSATSKQKAYLQGSAYKNEFQVLLRFVLLRLKSYQHRTFLTITRQIRIHKTFWKVPRQTNAYVSNKWPLKLPSAYLNTQGSSPTETPLKRIDDRKFFDIIMRYSLKMLSLEQYFVVLGKSIFLHFRGISNKLKKVVSIWVEMYIKSSIC
ncbi:hypothetical protein T07_10717 [Trichinella nelsoni]|uniref:Uncharacterized protein n=1 Tax=Trichinella nelsoni TaxID=6336 RepID=A0A0V0RNQ1_9BILA|nr:hypothetical protein T07_10717 [Trichinella nelsoni]